MHEQFRTQGRVPSVAARIITPFQSSTKQEPFCLNSPIKANVTSIIWRLLMICPTRASGTSELTAVLLIRTKVTFTNTFFPRHWDPLWILVMPDIFIICFIVPLCTSIIRLSLSVSFILLLSLRLCFLSFFFFYRSRFSFHLLNVYREREHKKVSASGKQRVHLSI